MKQFHTSVGIDLARRANHKAVIVHDEHSARASSKKAFSFSHDLEGFCTLSDHIREHVVGTGLEGVAVNVEPTSGVWEPMAAFLKSRGADVYFTRTDVVSALRKVHSKFAKTDRIDARTLASIPFSFPDKLIRVVRLEPRIRVMRELSAQRQRLVEDATRWKNRFVSKAEGVWGTVLTRINDQQRFCALARAFFKRFNDPRKVVRYGQNRFKEWCGKHAHGNTAAELFDALWQGSVKAAALWNELESTPAIAIDRECLGELLVQDLRTIEFFERETKKIDNRIQQARQEVPECDLLEQLPGVGNVITAILAGLLMPTARFSNAKKCGAYTGFTSRRKGSAGHEIEGLKITKSGNRRLKRALALAADAAMKNDPELAAFAIRLLRAGKHYNKVRVAVGRKIAIRAYSLLKRYHAGETTVQYIWRDLHGNAITKRQAKALASELWAIHKTDKKHKGSPLTRAESWQLKSSTKRKISEPPKENYA